MEKLIRRRRIIHRFRIYRPIYQLFCCYFLLTNEIFLHFSLSLHSPRIIIVIIVTMNAFIISIWSQVSEFEQCFASSSQLIFCFLSLSLFLAHSHLLLFPLIFFIMLTRLHIDRNYQIFDP
jgi:hypothetical protein